MSVYANQDEIEQFKVWWKNYGNALIIGVALGLAGLVGYNYYRRHLTQELASASVLYTQLIEEQQTQVAAARVAGEDLVKDYASTPYGPMAALVLAKLDYQAGNRQGAHARLRWALRHADDAAVAQAARLRLARLDLDSGDAKAALAWLNVKDTAGFAGDYLELRGDAEAALHRTAQARASYRAALKALPSGSAYARILQMKIDALAAGSSS